MTDQKNMQKFGAKLIDEDITKDDLKSTGFLRSDVLYWTINVLINVDSEKIQPI